MGTVTVLCDRVADVGGAERYWETVLPALAARSSSVRVLAREVDPSLIPPRVTWAAGGPASADKTAVA